jgi:hypothetical protein
MVLRKPGKRLIGLLERWAEAISGEFNSQEVANTLWEYATMGMQPGEGLFGNLDEQMNIISHEFISVALFMLILVFGNIVSLCLYIGC